MQNILKNITDEVLVGLKPFDKPIYISRPLLPNLKEMSEKLKEVWESGWLTNNGPQHQALGEAL